MAAIRKERIPHFVLTGAACAGKTKGTEILKERLWDEKGVILIVVPEVAITVFRSGVRQEEIMPLPGPKYAFERNTLSLQMTLDNSFMTYARIQAGVNKALVALCGDRGAKDVESFVGLPTFRSIAGDLGYDVGLLRDKYDAVFHLVTAANGAEEHYKNRYETPEQARKHSLGIIEAWAGHRYFRSFPNMEVADGVRRKISFEEKMDRLFKEVCIFLDV